MYEARISNPWEFICVPSFLYSLGLYMKFSQGSMNRMLALAHIFSSALLILIARLRVYVFAFIRGRTAIIVALLALSFIESSNTEYFWIISSDAALFS